MWDSYRMFDRNLYIWRNTMTQEMHKFIATVLGLITIMVIKRKHFKFEQYMPQENIAVLVSLIMPVIVYGIWLCMIS